MAKDKSQVEILSYGIYEKWDNKRKSLPKVQTFTLSIPAEVDIEFGFIINIKKAKGQKIRFEIDHPGILDKKGRPLPPFEGEEYIRDNNWQFYLGDTIWLPLDDKVGQWRMSVELAGNIIAEKCFEVYYADEADNVAAFWKKRGF
ncbi:DUF3859 domain-containing protein [Gayadomonas joobiniege]|uniref:DUF3859 domain-containing protein n=1 Tax=Gayadomonas joobiniege TaxID=1234606 RepID=UPI000382311A|nr:DUF3859 domain-containing protein [Gayadomonas joobiniege]